MSVGFQSERKTETITNASRSPAILPAPAHNYLIMPQMKTDTYSDSNSV